MLPTLAGSNDVKKITNCAEFDTNGGFYKVDSSGQSATDMVTFYLTSSLFGATQETYTMSFVKEGGAWEIEAIN